LRSRLPAPASKLAAQLLEWYAVHRRDLPWRRTRNPYRIWVSEVMLTQTQAAVAGRYYRPFLRRFPRLETLASAELPEVLQQWSGLGYYGRARNLHAAARQLVGLDSFPSSIEQLRTLPGFGPYTAAAVGSIAFGLPEPALDGNAVRVYSRLIGLRVPRAEAQALLGGLVRPLVAVDPGNVNQAVMDLGQLVCRARRPDCGTCPWARSCQARASNATESIPPRAAARPRGRRTELAACIRRGGSVLMARRRERGLFGGLWELPSSTTSRGSAGPDLRPALRAFLRRDLGLEAEVASELATVERVLTHLNLRLVAFEVRAPGRPRLAKNGPYLEARFFPPEGLSHLGMSSASKQLLSAIGVW